MNTALVIPAKIENSVKPPLKKAELIRALAIRKREQLLKERTEAAEIYRKESSAISRAITELAHAIDITKTVLRTNDPYVRNDNGRMSVGCVEAHFGVELPPELKKRIIANEARRTAVRFSEVPQLPEIERQLRAELNGQPGDRVAAVLKDEESVKMLDALLGKIDRRAEKRQLTAGAVNV